MVYWSESMQDDLYFIITNGWKIDFNIEKKKKKEIWDCDLIPKSIVLEKHFLPEQKILDNYKNNLEEIIEQKVTLEEENSGEEDLFSEVRSSSGNITKGELLKRIKEIKHTSGFEDETKILQEYLKLVENESDIKSKINKSESNLDKKLYYKYKTLMEEEIKDLVIKDKWMISLYSFIMSEIERISQKLTGRIIELAERYDIPLPKLIREVDELGKKVDTHLEKMGFKW